MQKLTFRENTLAETENDALTFVAFVGLSPTNRNVCLNEANRGLQVITPARAKRRKMQQCGVHFTKTHAIILSLTPENQRI